MRPRAAPHDVIPKRDPVGLGARHSARIPGWNVACFTVRVRLLGLLLASASLASLVGLSGCTAPPLDPEETPAPRAAETSEAPATEGSGPPAPTGPASLPECPEGPSLDDEALLARVPQAGAAELPLRGRLEIQMRTCEGERCDAALPEVLAEVAVSFARDAAGTWRGQLSPSASLTTSLAVDSRGAISGELSTFGASPATASVEGRATTSCFGFRAKATAGGAGGRRVETSLSFRADVPGPAPRVAVSDEPPVPSCDLSTPAASLLAVVPVGGRTLEPTAVVEQWRDCRAPTGCRPWQTGVVGQDGSSPWQRDPSAKVEPLTAWVAFFRGIGREELLKVSARYASSRGASHDQPGSATTLTVDAPLLGRVGQVDVKVSAQNVVYREVGGARTEPSEPRIRSRRFVCIPL